MPPSPGLHRHGPGRGGRAADHGLSPLCRAAPTAPGAGAPAPAANHGVGRHLAEAGSLLAYGTDSRALCQRSAVFVRKILHGVKPADLPIEQASFQLVVNLKTAKAPA